jgi:hypothetical protein
MEGLYGRIVHGEGGDVRVEGDGHHAANNHPFPSVFCIKWSKIFFQNSE